MALGFANFLGAFFGSVPTQIGLSRPLALALGAVNSWRNGDRAPGGLGECLRVKPRQAFEVSWVPMYSWAPPDCICPTSLKLLCLRAHGFKTRD